MTGYHSVVFSKIFHKPIEAFKNETLVLFSYMISQEEIVQESQFSASL